MTVLGLLQPAELLRNPTVPLAPCSGWGGGQKNRSNLCGVTHGPLRQIGPIPFSRYRSRHDRDGLLQLRLAVVSLDFSQVHTSPKCKRGTANGLPSLAFGLVFRSLRQEAGPVNNPG